MIKIGLLGLGTVGSGVYEIVNGKKDSLKNLTSKNVEITKVLVSDKNKKRNVTISPDLLTENPLDILNDPQVNIVIEVMGGVDSTYEYIKMALKSGKHVVTANKAVVAKHFDELNSLAKENNVAFLFEASVGGGIPIIKPLKQNVQINDISQVKGILNGTTNFILTKMSDEGLSFDEALDLATKLGYAEADPTDDIEGYDVARKLAILSSIAFKNTTSVQNILCRGIRSISKKDIKIFKQMGLVPKLVGNSIIKNNDFSASVEPVLVNENSTLGTVKNAFNVVSITGSTVGELQFYGQGAGKDPTANAVVSDLLDVFTGSYKSDHFSKDSKLNPMGVKLLEGKYYLRVTPKNKSQVSKILHLLKKNNLKHNILSMNEDIILIIDSVSAEAMEQFIRQLKMFQDHYCYVRIEGEFEMENKAVL